MIATITINVQVADGKVVGCSTALSMPPLRPSEIGRGLGIAEAALRRVIRESRAQILDGIGLRAEIAFDVGLHQGRHAEAEEHRACSMLREPGR